MDKSITVECPYCGHRQIKQEQKSGYYECEKCGSMFYNWSTLKSKKGD